MGAMNNRAVMEQIAATDCTFVREGTRWTGKCLICGGRLAFDAPTGYGANIEHIVPRSRGGDNSLLNLGLTHAACNSEKGVHWDSRRRRADPHRYAALLDRLLTERRRRWRAVEDA